MKKAVSFCAGYGTSDMARAAVMRTVNTSYEMIGDPMDQITISTSACWEKNPHCHQLLRDHSNWCNEVAGCNNSGDKPCMFSDMLQLVPPDSYDPNTSFLQRYFQLRNVQFCAHAKCETHNCFCPVDNKDVDLDVSGLPCQPNSAAATCSRVGGRSKQESPEWTLYIIWALWHIRRMTLTMILENVLGIPIEYINLLLGTDYFIWVFTVHAADSGHAGATRTRVYILFCHKLRGRVLMCPLTAYDVMQRRIRESVQTAPSDYLVGSPRDILVEAMRWAAVRKIEYRPGCMDLTYLLLPREIKAIKYLSLAFLERFSHSAEEDPDLCMYLGDNPEWSKTWSAISGALPTLRMSAGFLWFPFHMRWMLPLEKLLSQGVPVEANYARNLKVSPVPVKDPLRINDLVGNSMHFSSVAMIQLVGLSCLGKA